ncbi:ATP-binding protein [Petroclostridium sp. X23]|uniref:sensor histidine kinase n=1 Tax=Petroclostridium sp. X23 TaxID=3045146 RepID=UPI0024AC8FAC|nr:ATP-binding protein [Petroclostridium sp. X23]WHH57090.1 ATP-binding protein [Petroclostridium sp. X23]
MILLQTLTEIASSFVESIIVLLLFSFLNDKKTFVKDNILKSLVFFVLYTVFTYWASTYIPLGIHTACIAIFMIITLSYITKTNIYASIIAVAITGFFFMVTEVMLLMIEMSILNVDTATIINSPNYKLNHVILSKLVQMIISIMLLKFNFRLFKLKVLEKENSLLSFAILQIFMMTIFMISVNFVVSHPTNIVLYNVLLFGIYSLFVILSFLDYKERERILLIQHKFEAQKEYVKNMETVMNVIRKEKHDFANHLNTLLAICVLKKADGLERAGDYIRKLTNNLNSSYRVFNTGNEYVDGLMAVKSCFAFEHDIHLEVDIDAPLNRADIDDNHLTSIIGNIIDNAFEAILSSAETEDKVVSVCTYMEEDHYCLSIADNGPMIPDEIKVKIFDNGFSTKSKDKPDHGFGLYIVKQLVTQNKGEISVLSSEEETEFLIRLNVRKSEDGEDCSKAYQRNSA